MLLILSSAWVFADSGEYARSLLTPTGITGTARYMGMSGAMAAIGGDMSATADNPASIGLYRRSEVSIAFDVKSNISRSNSNYNIWSGSLTSFSWLFHFRTNSNRQTGVLHQGLSFSYSRKEYDREEWKAYVVPPFSRREQTFHAYANSRIDDYSMDYGMNISNKVYLGAGMSLRTLNSLIESEVSDTIFDDTKISNLGFTIRGGVIYRPARWLRLGAAVHSPIWVSDMKRLPMRTVVGMAFQAREKGLVSVEYDYYHDGTHLTPDMHLLKAGGEYVFARNGFINAGYAFSFIDQRHYASLGFSWRSAYFVAGMAYQFSYSQQPKLLSFFPEHTFVQTDSAIKSITNRIVFTFAWRYGG